MSSDGIELAANIATIYQVLSPLIIGGIAGLVGGFAYIKFFRKKEHRLVSNWKRPILIIPSKASSMQNETKLLKSAAFFDNVELLDADIRSADFITEKYRLVILRYEKDSKAFWKAYKVASSKKMPIIVYAEQGAIDRDDFPKIQEYLLHTICNTPIRLLSDVASIMGTYPSDKELK